MGRPIHFELHVDDMERAMAFYTHCFGWTFVDYSEYADTPYFGAVTGEEEMGINGALMLRKCPLGDGPPPIAAAVLTMGTDDFDATQMKILENGGAIALPKAALPGMAWQGYFLDTEGNVIGVHQPDENAK